MTPDKATLLASWVQHTPDDHKLHADATWVSFNMASRISVVDIVHRQLDDTQTPDVHCSNSPTTAAAKAASVFVEKAINQNMSVGELKCEANALCLALLVTGSVVNEHINHSTGTVEVPSCHLLRFVSAFCTMVSDEFLQGIEDQRVKCVQNQKSQCPPPRPQSLQHALRSPLQGAILFLDLVREDVQAGEVSIEDVDSVISSLNHIVRLLDENRDRQK